MTPKEKAIELALKFTDNTAVFKPNIRSKKMALFCVDKIIESKPSKPREYTSTLGYWQEVKNEIEEL